MTEVHNLDATEALIMLIDQMTQGQAPTLSERAYLGSGVIFGVMLMKRYPKWARKLEDAEAGRAYKENDVKEQLDFITSTVNIVEGNGDDA